MKLFSAMAASALALVAAAPAQSAVLFTLSGVTFNDGTAASGTFTTNDDVTAITDFSVSTGDGSFFLFGKDDGLGVPVEGFTYDLRTASAEIIVGTFGNFVRFTEDGGSFFDRSLYFGFAAPLSAATTDIIEGDESTFIIGRNVTAGRVVFGGQVPGGGQGGPGSGGPTPGAVPEPATWAMMIGGVGAIGGALRRRRSKVRTTVRFA